MDNSQNSHRYVTPNKNGNEYLFHSRFSDIAGVESIVYTRGSSVPKKNVQKIEEELEQQEKINQYVKETAKTLADDVENYLEGKSPELFVVPDEYSDQKEAYVTLMFCYLILKNKADDKMFVEHMAPKVIKILLKKILECNSILASVKKILKSDEKIKSAPFFKDLKKLIDVRIEFIGGLDMANHESDIKRIDEVGFYDANKNTICINMDSNMVVKAIRTGDITFLLNSFGHEYMHAVQESMKNFPFEEIENEELKARFIKIKTDRENANAIEREKNEVFIALVALCACTNVNISPKNLYESAYRIAFFRYYNSEHEIDAREFGMVFSEDIYNMIKDSFCFVKEKKVVDGDLKQIDMKIKYEVEQDKIIRKDSEELYEYYLKELSRFSDQDIFDILTGYVDDQLIENLANTEDVSKATAYFMIMQKKYVFISQILKTKDAEDIKKFIDFAIDKRFAPVINFIGKFVFDYNITEAGDYLASKLVDINEQCDSDFDFNLQYEAYASLSYDQMTYVIEQGIKQHKYNDFYLKCLDSLIMKFNHLSDVQKNNLHAGLNSLIDAFLNDKDIKEGCECSSFNLWYSNLICLCESYQMFVDDTYKDTIVMLDKRKKSVKEMLNPDGIERGTYFAGDQRYTTREWESIMNGFSEHEASTDLVVLNPNTRH